LRANRNQDTENKEIPWIIIILCCITPACLVLLIKRKERKRLNIVRPSSVHLEPKKTKDIIPVTDEIDSIIEDIQEAADLENQLRKNEWKMAKLHLKSLAKTKTSLANLKTKMLPIHPTSLANLKTKLLPNATRICTIPTVDPIKCTIPTLKVDLTTMMKEPEKIRHLSSVAKLKIKMLPIDYKKRRKRENFESLKTMLLPATWIKHRPKRPAPKVPDIVIENMKKNKVVNNLIS
jgi:hypothetical protein